MKYSVRYKRVYDKDNRIIHISSVTPENKEVEYYSIGTHTPMVAALGEKNQHYFRAKRGYQLNPETELHKFSKTILKHRFDIEKRFPIKYYRKDTCPFEGNCIFFDKLNKECGILEEKLSEFDLKQFYDTATIEGSYDGFEADVLLSSTLKKRRPVFIEVAVTHPCDPKKIASGNKIVEIDIRVESDAYRDLKESSRRGYNDDHARIKFHNFVIKNVLKECPHFVSEKKYSSLSPTVVNMRTSTKFYCCPHQISDSPLQAYYNNVEIGMLFASNTFAKPFVFDKAMSLDNKSFVIMGKDIYGAIKPWVVYSVTWNGKNFYYNVQAHFDYQSALKNFTLAQGEKWHGGDTLSDLCYT